MAVSGVSSSSIYGNRNVLSGLASGMDTESMIENMTQATRIKIAQQKQKKTALGWKQSAYQGISTQLIEFSKKYLDYTSPTNLLSSAFFDQSIISTVGKNNALVSATGKTNSKVEINGVKQLATSATHTASGKLQAQDLATGEFDISKDMEYSKLAGSTLTFKYGNETHTITLDKGAELKTAEQVKEEINKQLKEIKLSNGTLADKISAEVSGDSLTIKSIDTAGNEIKLTGASSAVQEALGIDKDKLKDGINLKDSPVTGTLTKDKLVQSQKKSDFLADKKITLSFNGQKKEITLLTKEEAEEINKLPVDQQNQAFQDKLQKKLDDTFGTGKITLERDQTNGALTFKTDKTNILKVTNGDSGIIGENSIFGFKEGDGNRLNMKATLSDLGVTFTNGADGKPEAQDLIINGVKVGSYGPDAKLGDIINDLNANKELGIQASYSETSNQFVLTNKETGANSKIKIDGGGLAETLFGTADVKGTDAIIDVTVNGVQQQLTRSSNDIDIDGMKVTVSGTFGKYDTNGKITVDSDETVTFASKPDTEKVFEAIKTMVEDYNKIVDSVYKEMTTKPNRDYQPLTDEQREEMSEDQIEKWEAKAKEGLLFGDTQLRTLHNSLRFIFNPGGEAGSKLRAMGFEPSKELKDGGKIKLDETKLRAALEADTESVKNAFNALASETPDPDTGIMNSASKGGVMTQMKEVTDKFASTSITKPGILVAHAGSPSSANSLMNNAIQKQMESIDKILSGLDTKLKKEVDRYNSQFTQLEMLISQMNAQSGQLAGLMGGGM